MTQPQSGQGGPGKTTDGPGISSAQSVENTIKKHVDGPGISSANDGEESSNNAAE